jgi:hypothetical protein
MPGRRIGGALAAAAAVLAFARGAAAQGQIDITLTQTPNVFPAATVGDYNAGFIVNPTGIVFTIDATGGPTVSRTTTVSIRSTSGTLGGGKPIGDLEWRRADLGTWNPMMITDAPVETRPIQRFQNQQNPGENDPWFNEVFLRVRLNWATDPPATYTAPIVFTLTVTTP